MKCIWSKAIPNDSLPKQKLFEVLSNQSKAELQLKRHFQVYRPQPNVSLFPGLISPTPPAGPSVTWQCMVDHCTQNRTQRLCLRITAHLKTVLAPTGQALPHSRLLSY